MCKFHSYFYSAEQTCIFPHLSIKILISLSSASDFWCKHLNLDITRETQLYLILLSLISGLKLFCYTLLLPGVNAMLSRLRRPCGGVLCVSVARCCPFDFPACLHPDMVPLAFEQLNSYWTGHFMVSVLGPCCNPSVIYQHSALGPTAAPGWGTASTSQCVPADSRVQRVSSPQPSPPPAPLPL